MSEDRDRVSDEVVALTEGYCNDVLDGDGLARLERLLLCDRAARTYFRRYLGLDAALHEYGGAVRWSPAIDEPPQSGHADETGSLKSQEVSSKSAAHANPRTPSNPRMPSSRPWQIGRLGRWKLRKPIAGLAGIVALCVAAFLAVIFNQREAIATAIATLEQPTGDVRILGTDGHVRTVAENAPIGPGDTVRTRGTESSAVVAYPDGTRLTLIGSTSVTCGDHRSKSVVVHQGTLAASVKPQPAERPLVLTTPSAHLQVLGTRFQVEALDHRTDLSVTEGRVRLVRIRDQQSVEVPDGKYATVTEQNTLLVKDIPGLPATWEETFETGLPTGWTQGEWVSQGLPPRSRGAVKAAFEPLDGGGANYIIGSNEAWLRGLFSVQKSSHLHFTFKTEKRGWINVFLVTRTAASDDARFSGNYLVEDFPKTGSGQWETVTIPLDAFKRIHRGSLALTEVVPFKLMFVSDGPDRGLVIDRVWVTADGPGRMVSHRVQ